MKEKRVYFIDRTEHFNERSIAEINSMTDKEFIEVAEEQGLVYSLEEFAKHWNEETLPWDDSTMRIIEVEVEEVSEVEFDNKSDLLIKVREQLEMDFDCEEWDAIYQFLRNIPDKILIEYLQNK